MAENGQRHGDQAQRGAIKQRRYQRAPAQGQASEPEGRERQGHPGTGGGDRHDRAGQPGQQQAVATHLERARDDQCRHHRHQPLVSGVAEHGPAPLQRDGPSGDEPARSSTRERPEGHRQGRSVHGRAGRRGPDPGRRSGRRARPRRRTRPSTEVPRSAGSARGSDGDGCPAHQRRDGDTPAPTPSPCENHPRQPAVARHGRAHHRGERDDQQLGPHEAAVAAREPTPAPRPPSARGPADVGSGRLGARPPHVLLEGCAPGRRVARTSHLRTNHRVGPGDKGRGGT